MKGAPMAEGGVLCEATHNGRTFHIEYGGEEVGYYLYVFVDGQCTHDYLQDTMQFAKEDARELFGVPLEAWVDA